MGKNKVEVTEGVETGETNQVVAGAVKKAFQPVVAFLQANLDKTVGEVIGDVIALTAAKGARMASTSLKDASGQVLAIFCYYHKQWELVVGDNAIGYSTKPNTATGLNSMCRVGNNHWNAVNNNKKKAAAENYKAWMDGTLTQEDAKAREAEANKPVEIVMDVVGYATKEEAIAALAELGYTAVNTPTAAPAVQ